MKPMGLIVNPLAGSGRCAGMADWVEKELCRRGVAYERMNTKEKGGAETVARGINPLQYRRLLVVGGDGTLNEVVRGLRRPAPPVSVFPGGTGNDVSRLLGIQDATGALETALYGKARRLSLGEVTGMPFVNVCSFGFDAEVAYQANRMKGRLPGGWLYLSALFKTLFAYQPPEMTLKFEEKPKGSARGIQREIKGPMLLVAACNGRYYGKGMMINPHANPWDGYMELCVIRSMPRWKLLLLFPSVYKGWHTAIKEVSFFRVRQVEVHTCGPVRMNRDGETWKQTGAFITMQTGSLSVMTPT